MKSEEKVQIMKNDQAKATTRLLFIGNSYTGRNNLPHLLTSIAASAPKPHTLHTQAIIANGMPLRAHWNKGEAQTALTAQPWNYVVLQEQSTMPLKSPTKMHESVRLFYEAIKQHGAQTVLYLTWARQDAPERQADLTTAYTSIARELGAIVVPVGVAWQRVLQEQPTINLHDADKSHPTLLGSYLAACVFYATLFGASPVGLWSPESLPDAERSLAERVAWKVVQEMHKGKP